MEKRVVVAVYQLGVGSYALSAARVDTVLVGDEVARTVREALAKANGVGLETLHVLTIIERPVFDQRAINADDEPETVAV